ncbi:MAG: glycosyltransferase [Candidatus Moraniibacteriota bacterium]|nr:MAG: glycosyltransferase [Candidatus Moranbacteria bacterium]
MSANNSLKPERFLASTRIDNLTIVFLLSAPFVVVFYASFVFNPANADHLVLYAFQVLADVISITVLAGLWVTVLLDVVVEWHHRLKRVWDASFLETGPTIDCIVTTYNEPKAVIRRTLKAVISMEYPHATYVFDDGQSPEIAALAKELGVRYVTRESRQHAKAGNLNNGLQQCTGDFFAVFDADQVPKPDFITTLLPYMANTRVAMVQSPQHYANTDQFIASGAAQAQEVFYRYVCPSKNISNSAFCVGTNMIFRRAAIDGIGGIAFNKSEDIWTSLKLHESGWQTIFVNRILAIGQAPDTVVSYFKQQLRWARGGLEMLFYHNPLRSTRLQLDQRIQYFMSNSFFLVGISIFVYLIFPLLYLLFSIKPLETESPFTWLVHYAPFFLLYYSLTWLLTGRLHLSTLATALATFYPYLMALLSVFFDKEHEWTATTSKKSSQDYFMKWAWPHAFIMFLTPLALIVGWYNNYDFWSTLFYSIWSVINMLLLYVFLTGEGRAGSGPRSQPEA